MIDRQHYPMPTDADQPATLTFSDGMVKRAIMPGRDAGGAPWVHRFEPGTGYGLSDTAFLKTAGKMYEHLPGVVRLVESLKPKPDTLYLLNASLVAGEATGFNARGDWFNTSGLLHTPPGWDDVPVEDVEKRRHLAMHEEPVHFAGQGWGNLAWGYPTWMNAHRFRHHVNTGPEHAYGLVLGAFWDERMQRVILVSELLKDWFVARGSLSTYTRIEAGEFCDTSMGCKVPFDQCSICGHLARTPAHYCHHTNGKDLRYGMKKLLPDGRRVGVYNLYPKGFDDSFVFVGAEKAAKVMARLHMSGSRSYSRDLPVRPGLSGLGGVRPIGPPAAPPAAPPSSARTASYYESGVVDGGLSIGGGGSLPSVPFGAASWDATPSQNSILADAAQDTFMPGAWTGPRLDALSRVLHGLPAGVPKTRAQKQHILQRLKKIEEVRQKRQTPENYLSWEHDELERLRRTWNIVSSDLAATEALLLRDIESQEAETAKKQASFDALVADAAARSTKTASAPDLAAIKLAMLRKRAEILKRLPPPSPGEVTQVRRLSAEMPDLPRGVLQACSQMPVPALRGLARMGVILRPHEYANMLHSSWGMRRPDTWDDPDCLVSEAFPDDEDGDDYGEPCTNPHLFAPSRDVPAGLLPILRDILSALLPQRSIAPAAIIIRVSSPMPRFSAPNMAKRAGDTPPGYRDYRDGIVADIEALRYGWRDTEWLPLHTKIGSREEHTASLLCRIFE